MRFVSVRLLHDDTPGILRTVERGEETIVTRFGKPQAAIIPLTEDDLEDFILWRKKEFLDSLQKSKKEYQKKGGKSLAGMERKLQNKRAES